MSMYTIEGNIAVVIDNNIISIVKLKPDRRYISPNNAYVFCINEERKEAKLLPLNDNHILLHITNDLDKNTLLQNIALQKLNAIFHITIENEKYTIIGFEYPSSL